MNQQNEDFKNTIHEFNEDFIQKLYYSCIGEGYHKVPNYNDNFQYFLLHYQQDFLSKSDLF